MSTETRRTSGGASNATPNSCAFSWKRPNSSYAVAGVTTSVDPITPAFRNTADRSPCLNGDPQDQHGDRKAHERVGGRYAGPYEHRRRDHTQGHETVDPGVVAVGDQ